MKATCAQRVMCGGSLLKDFMLTYETVKILLYHALFCFILEK